MLETQPLICCTSRSTLASTTMASEKKYDTVLFGATGFTGKLVAKYLRDHAGKPRWAIAGRSKERLDKLRSDLQLGDDVGLIEAENNRPDTLKAMARQAKSVINVVGPFRKLGAEHVVTACIAENAHYVDLSGETGFNETLIQKYHDKAKAAGVAITPSVGLDSLPSDLTTFLAVQYLKKELDCPGAEEAVAALKEVGNFSTGTLHSACDMADEDKRQLMFVDPGRLATQTPTQPMQFTSSIWLPQYKGYGGSFLLSPHNIRTVYRSWSLLQDAESPDAYGVNFRAEDTLLGGWWSVNQIQANVQKVASTFLLYMPGVRPLLRAIAPTGGGPSEKEQRSTVTEMRTIARYGRKSALCVFKAPGDPGYSMTARMISETALALVLDQDQLHDLGKQGGVLTAATVGANIIAERLEKYGSFEITTDRFSEDN